MGVVVMDRQRREALKGEQNRKTSCMDEDSALRFRLQVWWRGSVDTDTLISTGLA